ncbi:gamma-glutamylcyclotransferase [Maribacter sp. PR1]|nr:gamma-glutamylcyclotransferase family protein [Maribacter sp. PR1]MDC6387578.1 gamma-glutamylcyclotransferase [Maribacter sp. PR1]
MFTYGTLQEKEIQLGVFSRLLGGFDDTLHGHRISDHKVAGRYPTLELTENTQDQISGKVYILTDEELKKADFYEGEAYNRIEVILSSGRKAWTYLAK